MRNSKAYVLGGTVALTLISVPAAVSQGSLVVAAFGGPHGETLDQCVIDPFQEDTGINVVVDRGVSTVTLSKMEQQKNNPSHDVVWLDGSVAGRAAENDLIQPIDPERVPNISGLIDEAIYRNEDGEIWALNHGYYSTGIIYNKDEVTETPTSILDLWNEEYAGRVTWPSMADGSGAPMLVFLAEVMGGGLDNLEPGVEKLKELDVAAYYDSGGGATNLFTSGEAVIGILDSGGVWSMADSGAFPVGFLLPEEGGVGGDSRMLLVKSSDTAYQFLDYAMSKEVAECITETYWYGPYVEDVELSEEARSRLPWGPEGSIDDLVMPDFQAINERAGELVEIWNREIVSQ